MSHNSYIQSSKFSALSALLLGCASGSAATLSQVPDIPTVDVILSRGNEVPNPTGGGSTQGTFGHRGLDPNNQEGTRGRGQSFAINPTVVGETYNISSLSVALSDGANGNLAGGRPEGELSFTVFEFDSTETTLIDQTNDNDVGSDWRSGTGGESGTVLFSTVFDIAAGSTFSNSNLLEIAFSPGELELDSATAYGFFFQYTLDSIAGLNTTAAAGDVTIAFDADNNATDTQAGYGALLNTSNATLPAAGANGASASRDLNYFITGTIVPEPSSLALLVLGGLAFARRRR